MRRTRFASTIVDLLKRAEEKRYSGGDRAGHGGFEGATSITRLVGKVVVVAEKPKAARRIYEALSDIGAGREYRFKRIPYWVIRRNGLSIVIAPAAGHLFGLYTRQSGYPVFSYVWRPLYEVEKDARHTRKFIELLKRVCSGGNYFVNACDYDIEGSVIGYMVIKSFGDIDRCYRARFSSLTKSELRQAFTRLSPLDWNMVEAGLCRHELDWIWGINVSRALMESVYMVSGKRIILSAGRVQTPTLKYVVDNNVERNLFIPLPQYTISLKINVNGALYTLEYKGRVFETRYEAERVRDAIRSRGVLVVASHREETKRYMPPPPFNLGDLQEEAARIYGFSPYKTQSIAERLYLNAYISYPRTNSQKLPKTLNYRGILEGLSRIYQYNALVKSLLRETRGVLKPVEGPKEDPAHPAIYPTGVVPQRLSSDEQKIYDLIVRRFLAVFAPPLAASYTTIVFKVPGLGDDVVFQLTGTRVVEEGWTKYYYFHKPEEREAPRLKVGDHVGVAAAAVKKVLTKPPEKLSRIKILRWMEKNNIGTEATRARIIELLFKRKYLHGSSSTEATEIGQGVVEVLSEYFSELTSVELTRRFEQYLDDIRFGRRRRDEVIDEAKKTLSSLLKRFDEKKKEVGLKLTWRLGLLSPPMKCAKCRREAYRDGLCIYHYRAVEEVRRKYREWARREGIGWSDYIKALKKLKSVGKWVKDVLDLDGVVNRLF